MPLVFPYLDRVNTTVSTSSVPVERVDTLEGLRRTALIQIALIRARPLDGPGVHVGHVVLRLRHRNAVLGQRVPGQLYKYTFNYS